MSDALDQLLDAGADLRLDGDDVQIELPQNFELTNELIDAMRAEKPVLVAYAQLAETTRDRDAGRVPAHYTAVTECRRCGPVPIFPGCPAEVLGCPWCHNRRRGLPIPAVDQSQRSGAA